ncbi:MAG: hypothetical protein IKW14_05245 [Phascolarctobacterium sp.]|nr:hypothetical protein [Phascolarctobacterium sp.]
MLNVQAILNQLNVNPQMQSKVMSAYKTAAELSAGVQTKEQALNVLKQNGIDRQAMQKISKYLNHPLATMAAGFADVNISKVRSHFNILMDLMGSSEQQTPAGGITKITQVSTSGIDPLEKYKNGLRQL